ncbi:MAG TPA: hypothetical protein VGH99_01905 [Pseudonocardia sp.]|jgi:hypothetical protein
MDPSTTFYTTLVSTSFTLLGIWFGVMQFAHGEWRSDPGRHRSTLHIALHFFLPGMLGLGSLLAAGTDGGLLWRSVFVLGGVVGVIESLAYLRTPLPRAGRTEQVLRGLDPLLYALLVVTAFLPKGAVRITPLQVEGTITGLLFMVGLAGVWLAFVERETPEQAAEREAKKAATRATAQPSADH